MTSSVRPKRVRKAPEARRAEIVATAETIALTEGLELITVRRIADELAVRPGLISHYFPVAEDLVAEAFGDAATAELDRLIPADRPAGQALGHLARFLSLTGGRRYDDMSRLWLNARHLSRYRATLRDRVGHQESLWRERLTGLVREGVDAGDFRTDDPAAAVIQILVVLDGQGAHVNTDRSNRPRPVRTMAFSTAERVLDLPAGALEALAPAPATTDDPSGHEPSRPPAGD